MMLMNHENVQYTAPFVVGGQTLPVIYDTGSFEVLVLSTLCHQCAGQPRYDSAKSMSFTANDVQAEHLFGSGSVVSRKGYDTVTVGSAGSALVRKHFPFWQIMRHDIAVWDETASFSGIVGLGHPSRIPAAYASGNIREKTLLEALHVGSFSICLERGNMAPGWLTVGSEVDSMRAAHAFHAIPVVGESHWGVKVYDVSIPGLSSSNICNPSCAAIVDSGTS
eukprot:CAMPEP_0194499624 /NCGR_PEP_ID=MMETSP0253-20130528/15877_1 /TAXON_ID=2966 /ORGANISM="Noctiluca scintillans" /LENGTH=221 /DNA_ID=CAMNT_0039341391 /DNA_START=72 /DNA_END=734 /DNA_ORIENTATION=-